MTLPYDSTKPETRPNRVVFYTDDATNTWLNEQSESTDLELSLICHRIVKQARESAASPRESERRQADRRSA
jgi:hypothetical protein